MASPVLGPALCGQQQLVEALADGLLLRIAVEGGRLRAPRLDDAALIRGDVGVVSRIEDRPIQLRRAFGGAQRQRSGQGCRGRVRRLPELLHRGILERRPAIASQRDNPEDFLALDDRQVQLMPLPDGAALQKGSAGQPLAGSHYGGKLLRAEAVGRRQPQLLGLSVSAGIDHEQRGPVCIGEAAKVLQHGPAEIGQLPRAGEACDEIVEPPDAVVLCVEAVDRQLELCLLRLELVAVVLQGNRHVVQGLAEDSHLAHAFLFDPNCQIAVAELASGLREAPHRPHDAERDQGGADRSRQRQRHQTDHAEKDRPVRGVVRRGARPRSFRRQRGGIGAEAPPHRRYVFEPFALCDDRTGLGRVSPGRGHHLRGIVVEVEADAGEERTQLSHVVGALAVGFEREQPALEPRQGAYGAAAGDEELRLAGDRIAPLAGLEVDYSTLDLAGQDHLLLVGTDPAGGAQVADRAQHQREGHRDQRQQHDVDDDELRVQAELPPARPNRTSIRANAPGRARSRDSRCATLRRTRSARR